MFRVQRLFAPFSTVTSPSSSASSRCWVREPAPLSSRGWQYPGFPTQLLPPREGEASPVEPNPEPSPVEQRPQRPAIVLLRWRHRLGARRSHTDSAATRSDKEVLPARAPASYSVRFCIPALLREGDLQIPQELQGLHGGDSYCHRSSVRHRGRALRRLVSRH